MTTNDLLTAASSGDEAAFNEIVAAHRPGLYALCYRMLGSLHDAEDALQDTLVRAWSSLGQFEQRSALRSWLYAVATNVCLREIERRGRRVQPVDYGPASDPDGELGTPVLESIWLEPFPDGLLTAEVRSPAARYEQKESVELAFVAALQFLPPVQRAALIMRDVLAFSAVEVASALDTTPAAVNSALQRAHAAVGSKLPARSQQATLRAIGDTRVRSIVSGFVAAWERSDVDAVVAMLAQDVVMTMPPLAAWYAGLPAVEEFLRARPLSPQLTWRSLATTANGQPAAALYLLDRETDTFLAHSISILTLRGDRIVAVSSFLDPSLLPRWELPAVLDARPTP